MKQDISMTDKEIIQTINGILAQLHDPVCGIRGFANDLHARQLKREEYEAARMAKLDQIVKRYGLGPQANRSRKIFRMTGEDVVKNRFEWSCGHWAKAVCYLNNQLPADKRLELCVMMSTEINHLSDGMECHTLPCVRLSDGKWHAFEPRNKPDNAGQIEFLSGEIALGKTVEHLLEPIRGHQYKIVAIVSPEEYETKMGDFSYALEVFKGKLLVEKMKTATANVAVKGYAECKRTESNRQNQDSR